MSTRALHACTIAALMFASFVLPCTAFSAELDNTKPAPPSKAFQSNRPHHIMINALFDYAIVRDKLISPLLYHALQGGLTFGYEYRAPRHEHRIIFQAMAGELTRPNMHVVPGNGTYKSSLRIAVQGTVEYRLLIPVVRMQQWYLALGGMVATTLEARSYVFSSMPVLSFFTTWDFGHSILVAWQPAQKHNLRFALAMPVFSLVKRPAWNFATPQMERQADKEIMLPLYSNPHVTSVHEWFRLSFEFKHEWEITKLLQLNTKYQSTLLISSLPRFFGMLSNQVSIGLSFRL